MELRFSEDEEAFRAKLVAWLDEVLPTVGPPPPVDDWDARRAYDCQWQRMLFDAGYAGINWPTEVGGRGASPSEHLIFLEETERRGAPYVGVMFVALLHAGPTLIAEASAEQKAAHLPAILRGDQVWCQGFSEPQAGSDLASLRTRAVRDGDEYVINGSKIWTSNAQVADYCELLVRTDPDAPKHKGISWLILPMDTPGIDIRPLRSIPGTDEFSEVFFDDVRVPVANRVGAENDGWRVAMVTFSFERGTAFVSEMLASMQLVEQLAAVAKKVTRGSGTAWDDAGLRRDIGRAAADLDALWALVKRNVTQATHSGVPGPGGSVFKLYYSEMRHRLGELSERVFERAGLALDDVGGLGNGAHVEGMLHAISISIAAGTTQIQRNIVAERILGLPKDR